MILFCICIFTCIIVLGQGHFGNISIRIPAKVHQSVYRPLHKYVNIRRQSRLRHGIDPERRTVEFSFTTFLAQNDYVYCMGTLVSPWYVITTATCATYVTNGSTIQVLTVGQKSTDPGAVHTSNTYYVHPDFTVVNPDTNLSTSNYAAIALLEVMPNI